MNYETFFLVLCPHTLPYRGKNFTHPGNNVELIPAPTLYLVFVLKQRLQAVVVVSVSRGKGPYS